MRDLNQYEIYVRTTVYGESPEDALDYLYEAIDRSNLLEQDGVIGLEIDDDSVLEIDIHSDEEDDDELED